MCALWLAMADAYSLLEQARSIERKAWRMFVGGFLGFAVYCLLVVFTGLPNPIFRGYFDGEGVVKACLLPFGTFLLFSKAAWREVPLWVNLYTLFGAILVIVGMWIGARKRPSDRTQRMNQSS